MAGSGTGTQISAGAGNLKADVINEAFSLLRISGITTNPSPNDNQRALRRLESLARQLRTKNVCTEYNFEDEPDINSTAGLDQDQQYAYSCILAKRMFPDYGRGRDPDPSLSRQASSSVSFLFSSTANPEQTQSPSRQPIGSGNRLWSRYNKYYSPVSKVPNVCASNRMVKGDVEYFVEHFDSYLIDTEVISSFTIEADTGLTIDSSTNNTPDIDYRITATGSSSGTDSFLQVKIVVTTDAGRKTTRYIDFEVTTPRDLQ